MKYQKPVHFSFFSLLSILIILTLLASCDMPGSANLDLAATQQAMVFQQTQMAIGFQQTALAIDQTRAAGSIPPTPLPPTATSQPTYTPYPTYTLPAAPTEEPTAKPPDATSTLEPTSDIEARIQSANILIYEDIKGYPDLSPYVNRAVHSMSFSGGRIIEVNDALGDFMTQLNSPTHWDLIVVAAESRTTVRGEFWDVILDQVNKKVALVAELYYLDEIVNGRINPLITKCGLRFQKDWWRNETGYKDEDYSLYWLEQDHDLFKYPNVVEPLYTPNLYWWGDVGDLMKLGSGGDARLLAGISPREKTQYGVLSTCLEGRMVLQTFDSHDYRQSQVVPLWQNYIYYTLKNHFKAVGE